MKFALGTIIGDSPSGKAPGSGPGIRGFESLIPSQKNNFDDLSKLFFWLGRILFGFGFNTFFRLLLKLVM